MGYWVKAYMSLIEVMVCLHVTMLVQLFTSETASTRNTSVYHVTNVSMI